MAFVPIDPAALARARNLLGPLQRVHQALRARVLTAVAEGIEGHGVAGDDADGDTIYAIDRVGEQGLLEMLDREFKEADCGPVRVVGEGLDDEAVVGGSGSPLWKLIIDPIDGTRGFMYDKRSAWVLSGVAPDRGDETKLSEIVVAVQTELPTTKQTRADRLWCVAGDWGAEREDLTTGRRTALSLAPSRARSIDHGFASVTRFFPGDRAVLAAVDDEIADRVLGRAADGKAQCFEDQYASTGGQLYELLAGHDRFIADLRPLLGPAARAAGRPAPLCCHPYDLSAVSIAIAGGVIVTAPDGGPLDAFLAVDPDVAWVGYANEMVRRAVEPALHAALRARGLLPTS